MGCEILTLLSGATRARLRSLAFCAVDRWPSPGMSRAAHRGTGSGRCTSRCARCVFFPRRGAAPLPKCKAALPTSYVRRPTSDVRRPTPYSLQVRLLMEQPNSRCIELVVIAFHTQRPPVPAAPAVPAPASAAPPSAALSPAVAAAGAADAPAAAAAAAAVTPDMEEVHCLLSIRGPQGDGCPCPCSPRC